MSGSAVAPDQLVLLVDGLAAADRENSKAQARRAQIMVEFADARTSADQQRIREMESAGSRPRFEAGEFAAREIGMAVTAPKSSVQREVARARRLMAQAPDVWDAWVAGDVNEAKAEFTCRALRKLTRDESRKVLNSIAVSAAIPRTPETYRRWLERTITGLEPDQAGERVRRAVEDRYVSVRPDLDGVSFLTACLPALDATAVDLVLEALASLADAEPDEHRTRTQLRADALVDLVLGRISNGWRPTTDELVHELNDSALSPAGTDRDVPAEEAVVEEGAAMGDEANETSTIRPADRWGWIEDDWDLPAGAYRPIRSAANDPSDEELSALLEQHDTDQHPDAHSSPAGPTPEQPGRARPVICPQCDHRAPTLTVNIGVVVSIQSLLGVTDTPGHLVDGSANVPADLIRDLADEPGSLFYRLLTDPAGRLLDVTELGRFPSRRLSAATRFRDGICTNPACHTAADRCDLDHVVPWPRGATAGHNLGPLCRSDHRAKTHGGFGITKTPDGTTWTTPTGHEYSATTDPLPVEEWPDTG